LAKTAYALLYANLGLFLVFAEVFTPLIGTNNTRIVWALGSAFMVARLILYLLQVFMRCIKSPITQCMCASTIAIYTPPMLLTFVAHTLLAKIAYALLYTYLGLFLLLSEVFTPLIGASNPIVWALGSALMAARLILHLLQVFMRCIKSPITQRICAAATLTYTAPMLLKAYLTFVIYYLAAISETYHFLGPLRTIGSIVILERTWRFIIFLPTLLSFVAEAYSCIAWYTVEFLCDFLPDAFNVLKDVATGLVIIIRRCWRGYHARAKMRAQSQDNAINAVTTLQFLWKYHRMRRAVRSVQRWWRGCKVARTNKNTIMVEDASDSEYEDDFSSPRRNLVPGPGESWIEPVDDQDDGDEFALQDEPSDLSDIGSTTITGGKYAGNECIVLDYLTQMVRVKMVGSGQITTIRRRSLGLEKEVASTVRRSPRLAARR
jgi:hypothetical protein